LHRPSAQDGNVIKLVKLCQLQLQYLQWRLAAAEHARAALEDEGLALAAGLAAMPSLSLGDVHGGLGALCGGVRMLGEARVPEILEAARVSERGRAAAVVAAVVAGARRAAEERHLRFGGEAAGGGLAAAAVATA
jgi:hypothetical protein